MVFHRLDRISNIRLYDKPAHPIREVPGYENGIDYKKISSTMPYMYTDEPERIEFVTESWMVDQVIDWFGKDIAVRKTDDENKVIVSLWASPNAMEHWAMQYLNYVEVISPAQLLNRIQENLQNGLKKYNR